MTPADGLKSKMSYNFTIRLYLTGWSSRTMMPESKFERMSPSQEVRG
jgi:hypothetical protein